MCLLSDPLPARVADIIVRTSIANEGDRIGVAVSGGADSVALLSVLVELRERFGYRLSVLHVNHGLRGAESDLDEEFVRGLRAGTICSPHGRMAEGGDSRQPTATDGGSVLQPPSFSGGNTWQPPTIGGGNLEQAARDARRAFFSRLIREGCVQRIALAHTLSDQAETLLLRLFRGTGLSGLAGMRMASAEKFIRPFLAFTREEVRHYATEQRLNWREDSSNDDRRFRRNLVRQEIMPQLREAFHPHVERVLANTALLAQAEEDYWEQEAQRLFDTLAEDSEAHGLLLDADGLERLPLAAARRVVRVAIATVKASLRAIDSAHVDAILELCAEREGHSRVQVPGVDVLRSFDRLRFKATAPKAPPETRHYFVPIRWGVCATLPFHAGEVTLEYVADDQAAVAKRESSDPTPDLLKAENACFNAKFLKRFEGQRVDELRVRNWEPGDCYVPVGHSRPVKIKELFQESRVYLWERSHWPVLEGGGRILWSRLFGPASDIATADSEGAVARLTYYRKQGKSEQSVGESHRT